MPPTAGLIDSLFVAGGGSLFKIDQVGAASSWGIAAPPDGFTAVDSGAGVLNGVYKYRVTFKNGVTGSRSNANPTTVTTASLTNRQIQLGNLPISTDPQVNQREIWRTAGNGTVLFLLATIGDNIATTFLDNIADSALSPTQLPTDNILPDATFDDVTGPHAGRAWWLNSVAGTRGRIYFSPIGRPESVVGFIEPTNDDDPMQKIVSWGGSLWGFSVAHLFSIIGDDEPFVFAEVAGSPGTKNRKTVTPTKAGIIYQADEIYLFDGARSRPLSPDAMEQLFKSENIENLNAFTGVVATASNSEYFISDTLQTLAINLTDGTWRDLGIGCNSLLYEEDTLDLIASFNSKTMRLEVEGVLADDGAPIAFEIESPSEQIGFEQEGIVQMIVFDVDTKGEVLTPRLVLDGVETVLASITLSSRQTVERPIGKKGRVVGARLTGSVSNRVEVFGIGIEHVVGVPALSRT